VSEKSLERRAMEWLRAQPGCWAFKSHGGPFQQAGLPDIVGCYEGRFFGLELKMPGNKPTRLQEITLEHIRNSGGIAGVCYSLEDVKAVLGGEKIG
jgi:hypothetical protein